MVFGKSSKPSEVGETAVEKRGFKDQMNAKVESIYHILP